MMLRIIYQFLKISDWLSQWRIERFWKGVTLCVNHQHGWPTKKILSLRWSKKAKITLETTRLLQNISIRIFKFSPFLYRMEACQRNLISFSKFANAVIRKDKKTFIQHSMRKEKLRKVGVCLITGCYIKSFNMIINHFLFQKLIRSPIFAFSYQDDARNIKRGNRERQIARNSKWQYLFQK